MVHYLTEEMVRRGHKVTPFASGDSITSAELVPCTTEALRLDPDVRDSIPHQMLLLDKVRERAGSSTCSIASENCSDTLPREQPDISQSDCT